MVDCDASGTDFGAFLHQGVRPLAFCSKPFTARHMNVVAYERELIRLVQAVCHWRPYLWGHHFVVRTDHYTLKYMLDQRLSTVPQHQWMSKLFGFDFAVEYRLGHLNTMADALSRHKLDEAASLAALSGPTFTLNDKLLAELQMNDHLCHLHDTITETCGMPWHVEGGLILWGARIYISTTSSVLLTLLQLAHMAGHEGV
jgi:hypothetical protein